MSIEIQSAQCHIFNNGKSLPASRKALSMSFKKFSSAQPAPNKGGAGNKPKEAWPSGQPTAKPVQKPAEVASEPKS
jgi:hypothetical protein